VAARGGDEPDVRAALGRWFRSSSQSGPGRSCGATSSPAVQGHPGRVRPRRRARVGRGTDEAEDAVLDAASPDGRIRRTRRSSRCSTTATEVREDPGRASRSRRTPAPRSSRSREVLRRRQRVWFVSSSPKDRGRGGQRPEDEIQKIPRPPRPTTRRTSTCTSRRRRSSTWATRPATCGPTVLRRPGLRHGWYTAVPRLLLPAPYTFGFHVGYNPWTAGTSA